MTMAGLIKGHEILIIIVLAILLVIAIVIGTNGSQSIIQDVIFPEKTIIEFIKPYI